MRLKFISNPTLKNKEASIDLIQALATRPLSQGKTGQPPEEKPEHFYKISQRP